MPTEYVRAKSVEEAISALRSAAGEGIVLAGGLMVGSIINQKLSVPSVIVDISRIQPLRTLARTRDGGLSIGALVTHEDILRSAAVRDVAPLLAEIAADVACGRLRNRGTIGGSLCMIGQQGDPATGLIILGATIRLRGPGGARMLTLEEFYNDAFSVDLQEGEILEEVLVPDLPPRSGYAFLKIGPREAMDFTLIAVSVGVTLTDDETIEIVRIALNGVAPTVIRPMMVERLLSGKKAAQLNWREAIDALQGEISPQGDLVYSENHKRHLAAVALRRSTERALARAIAGRSAIQ